MADKINAAGYETKPWWPYVRELMEGGGSVTVEQLNVTENGTYTAEAGKAYSPVVVNVAGEPSDFSTATVTLTNSSESALSMADINSLVSILENQLNTDSIVATAGQTMSYEVVIYKNQPSLGYISCGTYVSSSGDVEYDAEEEVLSITGDCSIVIEGAGPG